MNAKLKNNSILNPNQNYGIILIGLMLPFIILIALFVAMFFYAQSYNKTQINLDKKFTKKYFEEYLEQKYNKDFEVISFEKEKHKGSYYGDFTYFYYTALVNDVEKNVEFNAQTDKNYLICDDYGKILYSFDIEMDLYEIFKKNYQIFYDTYKLDYNMIADNYNSKDEFIKKGGVTLSGDFGISLYYNSTELINIIYNFVNDLQIKNYSYIISIKMPQYSKKFTWIRNNDSDNLTKESIEKRLNQIFNS